MPLCLLFAVLATIPQQEGPEPDPRRVTDTVRVVQKCAPAVVSLRLIRPGEEPGHFVAQHGSGSIIHSSGIILTNWHVTVGGGRQEVQLHDGRVMPFEVLATSSSDDLALIRIDPGDPLPTITLGRSHDLMVGEPTLVIGNPTGLANSVSRGIVSGVHRFTTSDIGPLPPAIQTDAAINGGNSGGPLINALGEQIGVIASKQDGAENIGFAIAIDEVRRILIEMLAVEPRVGFWFGVELDPLAPVAWVRSVTAGSPAERAGVQQGDRILALGDILVQDALTTTLALLDQKPGNSLPVRIQREAAPVTLTVDLTAYPCPEPTSVENRQPGLVRHEFDGQFSTLPNFVEMFPAVDAISESITVPESRQGTDHFALRFQGYLEIENEGLHVFYLGSDDGSRLRIGDHWLIDHDGLHAHSVRRGSLRLNPGCYEIEVQMFEAAGGESLTLEWEQPSSERSAIPKEALSHAAPADD